MGTQNQVIEPSPPRLRGRVARSRSIIWLPRGYIYTIGASFVALVATAFSWPRLY
jgi:hypothetical protein